MTEDKRHVDLSSVEPVVRGSDPEDADTPEGGREADRDGTAATVAPGSSPAVGILPEPEEAAPADPDDLDRLRRG